MSQSKINKAEKDRKKRSNGVVGYQKFLKIYPYYKNSAICFVEGKDDEAYYSVRVESLSEKSLTGFVDCKGKQGVINTYEKIRKNKASLLKGMLFFVDKDFEESQNNADIYETPYHSLEHFYTTEEAFKKIMSRFLKIEEFEEDYSKCLDIYLQRQREFHEAMLELNAWIACQDHKVRNGQESDYPLSDIKLNEMLSITLNEITKCYSIETIKNLFPNAVTITDEELEFKVIELRDRGYHSSIRGKFELAFFIEFLEIMIKSLREGKNGLKKRSFSVALSKKNFVNDMSRYAETPTCLKCYITRSVV
ncbi:DUF4435 domain-containing protein [Bacillus sp. GB_SG_008]|uniref:DUF4435 domain-containing protein n=1 Tax=Bacillus sp. GB_SG_008 TaxID=3454627 RepID=UPI003F84BA06